MSFSISSLVVLLFSLESFAQEAAATAANAKGPSILESFLIPMLGFFAVFYFLVIRPQAKKAKETSSMLESLKKGDQVLTAGGILGTIVGVTEKFVDLKIADSARIKVLKNTVTLYTETN